MWELAQNAGALWVHAALEKHSLRVNDPADAQLFILPIDTWTSQKAGPCAYPVDSSSSSSSSKTPALSHEARMHSVLSALRASKWWARNGGRDHALVSLWWGTSRSLGPQLAALLQPRATVVAYDEYFAADWMRVVVGPCKDN